MLTVVHGIDFSGDAKKFSPGRGCSNVWVAMAQVHDDRGMELIALRPVAALRGRAHPFGRPVELLARSEYCAAAIGAPVALPARHMPEGGFPVLLRDVAQLPAGGRPFAKGEKLVAYGDESASRAEPKRLRKTEQFWQRHVSVRSTLWNGARDGAPFTFASLTILARAKRPVSPWCRAAVGVLVEDFPAAQLHHWELSHKGYSRGDQDGRSAQE